MLDLTPGLATTFTAATWSDPASITVLLFLAAATFGAGYDTRKHWKEKGWSARAVWNALGATVLLVILFAWVVWMARGSGI